MDERRRQLVWESLAVVAVAVVGWIWYCTLASHVDARILQGRADAYSIAVVEQVIFTYVDTGRWAQTIHTTYTDAWTWSEHRPVWIFPSAWLYALDPGPTRLGHIQLAVCALGGLFAYGLGRCVVGGIAGGLAAALVWYGSPSLAVVSTNVFQELVMGMPWLILAAWGLRAKRLGLFALGGVLCLAAREEWIPAVALLGLGQPGGWRPKFKATLASVAVAVAYVVGLSVLDGPLPKSNPMLVLGQAMAGKLEWQRSQEQIDSFYLPFLSPYVLALVAPLSALPGIAALAFQVFTPKWQTGVDAAWRDHIHHFAPVVAFFSLATIDALGGVVRLVRRFWEPRAWPAPWAALAICGLGVGAAWPSWRHLEGLAVATQVMIPRALPEWELVDNVVPKDASVATDAQGSLFIARHVKAYTYDESFRDKLTGDRLAQVDWILLNRSDTAFQAQLLAFPEIEEMGSTPKYILYRLR